MIWKEMVWLDELDGIEKETYDLIVAVGEIQTRNLPDKRMMGALASLKRKGLVEIYKRYTSPFQRKKKKFARVKQ